eukprot:Em1067g2a
MTKPFVLETDASGSGVGAVLSQSQDDGTFHPVAYASRSLTRPESNYGITELETLAVVWALTHFRGYLYGNSVTVYTDHAAVKAVLETPNPSGKHARWWSKVYESGVKSISIIYKSGKSNTNADALSRNPVGPATQQVEEVQVAAIQTDGTVAELLAAEPQQVQQVDFREEQKKDPHVMQTIRFLEEGELPQEEKQARKLALQAPMFAVTDGILYYVETKGGVRRVVLPKHLQRQLVEESHGGRYAGHFCGPKVYSMLAKHWWWEGMYTDVLQFCRSCPECAIATGGGRPVKPLLSPIPVQRPFQIFGVDLMELPATSQGNKCCGVPGFLLKVAISVPSTRSKKLNTTAYHPQCDGMVERFNRTLKTALRKHAAKFGNQWDRYLSGVLWAYRNTPHDSTGEKPSYLLFGIDCRAPLESSLLPVENLTPSSVSDYREELLLSLSSARKLACDAIQKAQCRYKKGYDKHARPTTHKIGDWILIKFPHEESGKNRKLSRPWHGPYRLLSCTDTDVVAAKVYFPDEGHIQVHQNRTTICPRDFPNGYYWYGKSQSSNKPCPQWLDAVLGSVGRPDEGTTDSQQANKELQDQASTEAAAPSPTTEDTSTDSQVILAFNRSAQSADGSPYVHEEEHGTNGQYGLACRMQFQHSRPADILLQNWNLGRPVALDISVVSPLNPSTLAEAGATFGAVLEATESRKHQANDEKCSALGWVSTPLAVDSYGAWGKEATLFLAQVAARLAIHKSLPKSQASFDLFSNLSICLIRANARAILRRV